MELAQYQPLPSEHSIRLIDLHPATDPFAPLECTIVETPLSTAENQFEAVSYAIGNQPRSVGILFSEQTYRPITEQLSAALCLFRLSNQNRLLWVDALTINQDDVEEKASQVSLMSRIYASARVILAWLGEDDGRAQIAIETCQTFAQETVDYWQQDITRDWVYRFAHRSPRLSRQHDDLLVDATAGKAILALFARPWWHRRWVVQEVALARQVIVYCGKHSFHWVVPFIALKLMSYLRDGSPRNSWNRRGTPGLEHFTAAINLLAVRHSRSRHDPGSDHSKALKLLIHLDRHHCTDPRDLVFSLIGIASDLNDFKPDYHEYYTTIFRRFAEYCLFNNNDLKILSFANPMAQSSYVPDLLRGPATPVHSRIMQFRAGKQDQPCIQKSWDCNPIIQGYVFDRISQDCDLQNLRALTKCQVVDHVLRRWYAISQHVSRQLDQSPEYLSGTFVDTLVYGNRSNNLTNRQTFEEHPQIDQSFHRLLQSFTRYPNPEAAWQALEREEEEAYSRGQGGAQDPLNLARAIARNCANRRFVFTSSSKRYLALVPPTTRVTDIICIFSGSECPIVLRPETRASDGHTVYRVVGDCYVHEMMYGEVFELGLTKEMFELI